LNVRVVPERFAVDANDLDKQIQFARHNFDNHQSLIRASDAKAGATATIMVFLAASALQISKDAIGRLHTQPCPVALGSGLFILASIGLFFSVLRSFIAVHRVLRPRGARFTPTQKGHELMWQDHVLLHQNNEEYFSAVRAAPPELILRNLTDQIFELAHISKEKMDALTNIRSLIWLGFASWVTLIASGLLLGRH
jgi:hypothetical protein